MQIALSLIRPSPRPVRTTWDEEKMDELAASIKEQGVIVPVKVRPAGEGYEVVYGHRRIEAARRAGLGDIEAIIEGVEDTDALVQALIENIQREDMEPLDTAHALNQLKRLRAWSNMDLERHGIMPNNTASKYLTLLAEPEAVQRLVAKPLPTGEAAPGSVTASHVREVRAAAPDESTRVAVIEKAAQEGMTAMQARRVAESVAAAPTPEAKARLLDWEYSPAIHDPDLIRSRAQQYGARDPMYQPPVTEPADQEWRQTPEVATAVQGVIEATKRFQTLADAMLDLSRIGKMAPEAKRFVAHRLRQLAERLLATASKLEEAG